MVDHQYAHRDLVAGILGALAAAGRNLADLAIEDLAPIDQFHTLGARATVALADAAGVQGQAVLDIGCGIGGPARYLAKDRGCRVIGIDATFDFCAAMNALDGLVGAGDAIGVVQGDAIALPFRGDLFDCVWVEHVSMNVHAKAAMFAETARVLRQKGRLALFEVVAGNVPDLRFPVPWADGPTLNALVSGDELVRLVTDAGFLVRSFEDLSEQAEIFFARLSASPPPLSVGLIVEHFDEKVVNCERNLAEDRMRVVRVIAEIAS